MQGDGNEGMRECHQMVTLDGPLPCLGTTDANSAKALTG